LWITFLLAQSSSSVVQHAVIVSHGHFLCLDIYVILHFTGVLADMLPATCIGTHGMDISVPTGYHILICLSSSASVAADIRTFGYLIQRSTWCLDLFGVEKGKKMQWASAFYGSVVGREKITSCV
jgi:hypothetical protein